MAADPILVLQMQRMGDLVLTFPLLSRLRAQFPGHPVWVVAEKQFYQALMPLSPKAVYFDAAEIALLGNGPYRAVINLSHRPEALAAAGRFTTGTRIGPYLDHNGFRRVAGNWQLYRESLTFSNRHNRYHWADLNCMDLGPLSGMARASWPPVRKNRDTGRIGLFLGASEEDKRPSADFWIGLTRTLLGQGLRPVLLGGEAERTLGAAVVAGVSKRAGALNLCGKFSVRELADFLSRLDLLVTPDTGPMHVAAWTGTRTLNLSMGPVNAWETGPFGIGHLVLRPRQSCVGCWACNRPSPVCRERFSPRQVALIIRRILTGNDSRITDTELGCMDLSKTERDRYGLYTLQAVGRGTSPGRGRLAAFWKAFFGHCLGDMPYSEPQRAALILSSTLPQLAARLSASLPAFGRDMASLIRQRCPVLPADYWMGGPPLLRPFRSLAQAELANADYRPESVAIVLNRMEVLARLFA